MSVTSSTLPTPLFTRIRGPWSPWGHSLPAQDHFCQSLCPGHMTHPSNRWAPEANPAMASEFTLLLGRTCETGRSRIRLQALQGWKKLRAQEAKKGVCQLSTNLQVKDFWQLDISHFGNVWPMLRTINRFFKAYLFMHY